MFFLIFLLFFSSTYTMKRDNTSLNLLNPYEQLFTESLKICDPSLLNIVLEKNPKLISEITNNQGFCISSFFKESFEAYKDPETQNNITLNNIVTCGEMLYKNRFPFFNKDLTGKYIKENYNTFIFIHESLLFEFCINTLNHEEKYFLFSQPLPNSNLTLMFVLIMTTPTTVLARKEYLKQNIPLYTNQSNAEIKGLFYHELLRFNLAIQTGVLYEKILPNGNNEEESISEDSNDYASFLYQYNQYLYDLIKFFMLHSSEDFNAKNSLDLNPIQYYNYLIDLFAKYNQDEFSLSEKEKTELQPLFDLYPTEPEVLRLLNREEQEQTIAYWHTFCSLEKLWRNINTNYVYQYKPTKNFTVLEIRNRELGLNKRYKK